MWLCLFSGWPFEDTFENARWGKVKQMQPMWLCLFSGRRFEETFENTQWGKVKQMQPVWLCLLCPKFFEETYEEAQCSVERRKGKSQHLSSSADARRECAHWKTYFSEKKDMLGKLQHDDWWGKNIAQSSSLVWFVSSSFSSAALLITTLFLSSSSTSLPMLSSSSFPNTELMYKGTTLSSEPITPNMTNFAHWMSCRKCAENEAESSAKQLRNMKTEKSSWETEEGQVDKLEAHEWTNWRRS